MEKIFKIICKKCGGKCCKLDVMLTRKDYEKLKDKIDEKDFEIYGKNIFVHWGRCPFLDLKGCTLPEDKKPFDCKLFPLTFIFSNNKIKIFLNEKCPYTKEIPEKWITQTKKWLKEELRNLPKEELQIYSHIIRKNSASSLILLEEFYLSPKII